jgi:hypothetical protein
LCLHCRPGGPDAQALRLSHVSLTHLPRHPHLEALAWHWQHWCVTYAEMGLEGTSGQAGSPARLRSPRHGRR